MKLFPVIGMRLLLLGQLFLAGSCLAAGNSIDILERSGRLEADSMTLLGEHYRFEEALASEENDRLMVFLSIPHGARVIVDEIRFTLDGKVVSKSAYSVSELMAFQNRATQLLYVSRIRQGEHTLRIDLKVMQGKVEPMQTYSFSKEGTAKYVDIQITGSPVRQIEVMDW